MEKGIQQVASHAADAVVGGSSESSSNRQKSSSSSSSNAANGKVKNSWDYAKSGENQQPNTSTTTNSVNVGNRKKRKSKKTVPNNVSLRARFATLSGRCPRGYLVSPLLLVIFTHADIRSPKHDSPMDWKMRVDRLRCHARSLVIYDCMFGFTKIWES